jgi:hypothetical protein
MWTIHFRELNLKFFPKSCLHFFHQQPSDFPQQFPPVSRFSTIDHGQHWNLGALTFALSHCFLAHIGLDANFLHNLRADI